MLCEFSTRTFSYVAQLGVLQTQMFYLWYNLPHIVVCTSVRLGSVWLSPLWNARQGRLDAMVEWGVW